MFKPLIISFLGTLLTTSALANSCLHFVGQYVVGPSGCLSGWPGKMYTDITYSAIDIAFQPNSYSLEMIYYMGSNHFTVNYIADYQDHPGDGINTGSSYTAGCNQNQLNTRRVGLLKNPFVTTLTLQEDGIDFVESFEGDTFTRVCKLVSAP